MRRRGWEWALILSAMLAGGATAAAEEVHYLRVGTGPPGETHFPMGGVIAGALSNPPGSRPCERGGSCGVPGVVAIATATNGSAFNATALGEGRLELAVVQADIARWAARGAPPFGKPVPNLLSIARLYSDQIQLIARRDAHIDSPRDLRGKRVSLGIKGSGTLTRSRLLLAAWGIREGDLKAEFQGASLAADAVAGGRLDAFFVVDAAPVPVVAELARSTPITVVPLAGDEVQKIGRGDPLLHPDILPANTYDGQTDAVPVLSVAVNLVVSAALPDDLVYAITRALWHPTTIKALTDGRGAVTLNNALVDLGAPLHPGARRFYAENGLTQ